jgi:hypothetical protein
MTFLSNPKGYTPLEFDFFVNSLKWTSWKPKFITLHNTGEPSLKQWMQGNHGKPVDDAYELQRMRNLIHYYKDQMKWHSGPHLIISPRKIWTLCDLTQDGVSVRCWNKVTLALEMVGDYSHEAFDSGDGAKVRDLTVSALASLHKVLKLTPLPYLTGSFGLHPHTDCVQDRKTCPGKLVSMVDMRSRVAAAMGNTIK